MFTLGPLVGALSLIKDDQRLVALIMIVIVVGVIVLAVVAGGVLDPGVFGIIFFGMAIILLIAGVISVAFILRGPLKARHVTEQAVANVADNYTQGRK